MRRLSDPLFQRLPSTQKGSENAHQRLWTSSYFRKCDLDEKVGVYQHFIEIDNKRPVCLRCRILSDAVTTQSDWLYRNGAIGTHTLTSSRHGNLQQSYDFPKIQ